MPIARLDSRALILVAGPDAPSVLNGLLTQDTETLASGQWRYGALLGPQGRLLFDLFLLGTTEGVILDCHAPERPALIQRLALYRLRAQVSIAAEDRPVMAAWGAEAHSWPDDPRLPGLARRVLGPAEASASEADWRAYCLERGVADSADFLADADYPIECNFDLLNGIDFHKGCFVGQETASRMKRRGKVKSRLVPITFDGPPPPFGAEVLNGELRAGQVRSGMDGRAMALLRLDRLKGELRVDGLPVRPSPPDWLPLDG